MLDFRLPYKAVILIFRNKNNLKMDRKYFFNFIK